MVLLLLLVGHALCDFGLQSEWIAKYKNPANRSPAPPGQTQETIWPYVLGAHAMMHGGAVALVTQRWELGTAEFVVHFLTDYLKCKNVIGLHADQAIHLFSKFLWWTGR